MNKSTEDKLEDRKRQLALLRRIQLAMNRFVESMDTAQNPPELIIKQL